MVLDAVGGIRFAEALKAVGHGGRVVALANVALEPSAVDTRDFYPKNVTIHGFQLTNLVERLGYDPRGDLKELARLAVCGELKVHVDVIFPLAEAHRHMEGRRNQAGAVVATDSVSVDAVATTALRFRRCLDAEGVRDVQIAA